MAAPKFLLRSKTAVWPLVRQVRMEPSAMVCPILGEQWLVKQLPVPFLVICMPLPIRFLLVAYTPQLLARMVRVLWLQVLSPVRDVLVRPVLLSLVLINRVFAVYRLQIRMVLALSVRMVQQVRADEALPVRLAQLRMVSRVMPALSQLVLLLQIRAA